MQNYRPLAKEILSLMLGHYPELAIAFLSKDSRVRYQERKKLLHKIVRTLVQHMPKPEKPDQ